MRLITRTKCVHGLNLFTIVPAFSRSQVSVLAQVLNLLTPFILSAPASLLGALSLSAYDLWPMEARVGLQTGVYG